MANGDDTCQVLEQQVRSAQDTFDRAFEAFETQGAGGGRRRRWRRARRDLDKARNDLNKCIARVERTERAPHQASPGEVFGQLGEAGLNLLGDIYGPQTPAAEPPEAPTGTQYDDPADDDAKRMAGEDIPWVPLAAGAAGLAAIALLVNRK